MVLSTLRTLDIQAHWDQVFRAAALRVAAEVADDIVRDATPGNAAALVRGALRISETDGVPDLVSREFIDSVTGIAAQAYVTEVARREGVARGMEAADRVVARVTASETVAGVAAGLRTLLAEACAALGVSLSRIRDLFEAARSLIQQFELTIRNDLDVQIRRRDALRDAVAATRLPDANGTGARSAVRRFGRTALRAFGVEGLTFDQVEALDAILSAGRLQLTAATFQLLGSYLVEDVEMLKQSIAVLSEARDTARREAQALEEESASTSSTLLLAGPAVSQALARAAFGSDQALAERAVSRWAEAYGWSAGLATLLDILFPVEAFEALTGAAERGIRKAARGWTAADLIAEVIAIMPAMRLRLLHALRRLADLSFIAPEFLRNGGQYMTGQLCVAPPAKPGSVTLLMELLRDAVPSVRFVADTALDPDIVSVLLEVDGVEVGEMAIMKAQGDVDDPRFDTLVSVDINQSGTFEAQAEPSQEEAV